MKESVSMRGEYLIEIRRLDGELIDTIRLHNKLMKINRDVRSQMLLGTYTGGNDALHIKYFAFGTGTAAATENDTRLTAEVYRKQITQIDSPSAGVVRSVVSLGALECNEHIREIGVFCGTATAVANSGTMISRILVDIEKNSNVTLNIVRSDVCTI